MTTQRSCTVSKTRRDDRSRTSSCNRAGSTEGPALRDAIAATRNFPGVSGNITIDAERNATKAAVIIGIKDGHFTFVTSVAP